MRILHTMLRVGDLDRSLAFYTEVLGMHELRRQDYPSGRFTLAFVGYGPESAGAVLELTHNWDTPAYEIGTGFGHVAIEVADAYAACAEIKARGGMVVRGSRADEARNDGDRFRRGPRRLQDRVDPEEGLKRRTVSAAEG